MAASKRDPYDVLGVPRGSDLKTAEQALRKLAKANHPDLHPGDAAAERRFKEMTDAYAAIKAVAAAATAPRPVDPPAGAAGPPIPPKDVGTGDPDLDEMFSRMGMGLSDLLALQEAARRAEAMVLEDHLHEGDVIEIAASPIDRRGYALRRVYFHRPDDPTTYRTLHPILCREVSGGYAAFTGAHLAPGHEIRTATGAECRALVKDQDRLRLWLATVSEQRRLAAGLGADIRRLLGGESFVDGGTTYRERSVVLVTPRGRVTEPLLCADDSILETRAGEPENPQLRFASGEECGQFADRYRQLRGRAADFARARGETVPPLSLIDVGRIRLSRLLDHLGE